MTTLLVIFGVLILASIYYDYLIDEINHNRRLDGKKEYILD